MSKFAVMTFRNTDGQSTDTGILSRLMNVLKGWHSKPVLQPVGTIYFKQDGREMGYILQLPDFMVNWDVLSTGRRSKRLLRYLRLLKELGVEAVCIPNCWVVLPQEAVEAMKEIFAVDSVYQIRVFALANSIKHLLGMLKDRVSNLKVGIWGADTWAGRLFARVMAPYINDMVLGGTAERKLYELADEVLMETGLACPVTTDAAECLKNKQLVAVADECDFGMLSNYTIVAYAAQVDLKYIEAMKSRREVFWILSGWATLPDEIKADIELMPWESLGVLQALSIMGDEIGEMSHILEKVRMRGFISLEGGITYDTFRIRYLRKKGVILFP